MARNRITNPAKRRRIEQIIGGPALWVHTNGGLGHTIEAVRADGAEFRLSREGGELRAVRVDGDWTPRGDGSWSKR